MAAGMIILAVHQPGSALGRVLHHPFLQLGLGSAFTLELHFTHASVRCVNWLPGYLVELKLIFSCTVTLLAPLLRHVSSMLFSALADVLLQM